MQRPLDALVLGLGVVGAAALDALARRGLRVAGIDRFALPNAMGSSHGGSRVIRMAYFEGPDYVPLLYKSWRAWEQLEAERGERLLRRTGILHFGPEALLTPLLDCARTHALPHQAVDAVDIARRWPAFAPDAGDRGVYEDDGGVLYAERCVSALLERALAHGAEARGCERVIELRPDGDGVTVRTERATLRAGRVVLALGAWSEGDACPLPLPWPLQVMRQVQLWFAPRDKAAVSAAKMPAFLRFGADGVFYGMPPVELPGVKVCEHFGGEVTRAEALDRSLRPSDEARVRAFVQRHLPAADGALLAARVCMYTTTPDQDFIVGAHPDGAGRVVVACGLSGHGFKMAPALGELLADHVDGRRTTPLAHFDPGRFAT